MTNNGIARTNRIPAQMPMIFISLVKYYANSRYGAIEQKY